MEELFRFAAEVEQAGLEFYGRLIQASANPRVQNELKFLRDEEARHKAFFLEELTKKGQSEVGLNPKLKEALESEFLKPLEEFYRAGKIGNSQEALRFGVTVEQKTIDFYSGFYADLRRQSADPSFLKDLDAIIGEEQKHKQKLNLILAY